MSEEQNATVIETPIETANPPVNVDSGTTNVTAPVEQPKAETPENKVQPPKWALDRINQQTKQKHEAIRRAEEAEKQLRELQASGNVQPQTPDFHQEVARAAQTLRDQEKQQTVQESFNESCNKVYETGTTEFPDFAQAVETLNLATEGLPNHVLEAVLELPNPHAVLRELGNNIDEGMRIISLSPVKMAMALSKVSENVSKPVVVKAAPVSGAPAPVSPIDALGKVEGDQSKMSTVEWMAWRDRQLKSKG